MDKFIVITRKRDGFLMGVYIELEGLKIVSTGGVDLDTYDASDPVTESEARVLFSSIVNSVFDDMIEEAKNKEV